MSFLIKSIFNAFKRISKLTLFELLWGVFVLCMLFVFWMLRNNYSDVHVIKTYEYLPLILWWTDGFPGSEAIRSCSGNYKCRVFSDHSGNEQNADAYLFYGSNIKFDELPLPRRPKQIIWGLYHEESPRNVEELTHEETLRLFNYSSTFSRYSDIPYPLQFLDSIEDITSTRHFVSTQVKNKYEDIAPIMYLQTDCETATERDLYVKELMKYVKIDSYGACLKNKDMPAKFTEDYLEHLNDDDFLNFIARYKFVLAIENGVCDDYVTEKFWRAIKVGTVPIYFGSPSIRDWLPNKKSAILLDDYPTPELMSKLINNILADDNLYEEYLEHKTKKIITNSRLTESLKSNTYQTDALQVVENFECFICERIHDLRMGVVTKSVVSKLHYNCPKPLSALTLQANLNNDWVYSWERAGRRAKEIEKRVLGNQ